MHAWRCAGSCSTRLPSAPSKKALRSPAIGALIQAISLRCSSAGSCGQGVVAACGTHATWRLACRPLSALQQAALPLESQGTHLGRSTACMVAPHRWCRSSRGSAPAGTARGGSARARPSPGRCSATWCLRSSAASPVAAPSRYLPVTHHHPLHTGNKSRSAGGPCECSLLCHGLLLTRWARHRKDENGLIACGGLLGVWGACQLLVSAWCAQTGSAR